LSLRPKPLAGLVCGSLLSLSASAQAAYRSLDTQLVQPALQPEAAVAVDGLRFGTPGKLVGGSALQLEHMPLEYFQDGQSAGPAVRYRGTLHIGAGVAVSRVVGVQARFSGAYQLPGDEPELKPEHELGTGDLGLGVKAALYRGRRLLLGPSLDLWLPIGAENSWISETQARYCPALLADADLDALRLLGRVGLVARPTYDSGYQLDLGSELALGLAALVPIKGGLSGLVEASSRHGFANFMQQGAENPVELKAGARLRLPRGLQLDLVAGTGLTNGYGTADLRVLTSLVWFPPMPPPVPSPVPNPQPERMTHDEPPPPEPDLPLPPASPSWEEGVLAQVHRGRIVIREPVQFALGTAEILPPSLPVLQAVADVMNAYGQIELLVIEGHASQEGPVEFNYELSNHRAAAVYRALVASGVRPERLAFRGRGETVPVEQEDGLHDLAEHRRVEFRIARLRDYLALTPPTDPSPIVLPWSGDTLPSPQLGEGRLSAQAHPILLVESAPAAPATPDPAVFAPGFEDEELP